MSNTLIAYFSRAGENYFGGALHYVQKGNTQILCEKIMEWIDADSYHIEMKNPYSPFYLTCIDEAKKDLKENARPELLNMPKSIEKYDNIILAYPNYWGSIPMAVATFLESYDFSGKSIFPLCTNEGSGMGTSERDIQKHIHNATLKSGLAITGSQVENCQNNLKEWLTSNGF